MAWATTAIPPSSWHTKQLDRTPDSATFFVNGKPPDYVAELFTQERTARCGLFDVDSTQRLFVKCQSGRAFGFADNRAFVGILSTLLLDTQSKVRLSGKPMDAVKIRKQMRDYLLENMLFSGDQSKLDDKESLLQKGVIDSTGILEIVNFLETTFAVTIKDTDLLPEHFDSVDNIVAFVGRLKG